MSTSLVYHAFVAKTYQYVKTEYDGGRITFHLEKKPEKRRCAGCRSKNFTIAGGRSYRVRALPIGSKPVFLVLELKILSCWDCKATLQESRDVAEPRKSYIKAFARFVLELSRKMTIKDIAEHLKVGWDLIKEIVRDHLNKRLKRRSWGHVRRIGIDEIAVRKGHRYMTVVVDLDTGQVLYTAPGRDHTCLEAFFRGLRKAHARLQAIAVDMNGGYLKAISDFGPPGVVVVHDHYHLVSNMNQVVDQVRRDEQRRLEDEGKKTIKGARYLLLFGRDRLEREKPEKLGRLDALLAANETLHKAYLLKEDVRLFWKQRDKRSARKFLKRWVTEALAVGNKHLSRFASTVRERTNAILAWYDQPITTGPLEGLNNKIKVLKRRAYGYRDLDFFQLLLCFIHESEFKLAGT